MCHLNNFELNPYFNTDKTATGRESLRQTFYESFATLLIRQKVNTTIKR